MKRGNDGSSPLARGTRRANCRRTRPRPVHPRWRGEHMPSGRVRLRVGGSSPLARGTPSQSGRHTACGSVHTRWRGEHSRSTINSSLPRGSSPLARGTQRSPTLNTRLQRFIPAGAGNTSRRKPATRSASVHPRWRGEHRRVDGAGWTGAGSSPLARGTRVGALAVLSADRFIPAGAGNTPIHLRADRRRLVHPRWRGEHRCSLCSIAALSGSSPLARGTLLPSVQGIERVWFIPAGAGNTPKGRGSHAQVAVHPRWRGEHLMPLHLAPMIRGSSPLARGTPPR